MFMYDVQSKIFHTDENDTKYVPQIHFIKHYPLYNNLLLHECNDPNDFLFS